METKVYSAPTLEECAYIGTRLREGALVAIPTETVYGLGANGLDESAMERIYEAKGRPSDNPLILHVADASLVPVLVKEVSPLAQRLMDTFWPGPLTIVLPKSDLVPYKATGGLDRVALRCPDQPICQAILRAAGVPVAAPSANISGRPSPTTAVDVAQDMAGRIDIIVDGGACPIGVESTVLECNDDDTVTILRPGGVTEEMLSSLGIAVRYDTALTDVSQVPKAPGMKYTHYAPDAPMVTYVGPTETLVERWKQEIKTWLAEDDSRRAGLFMSQEMKGLWPEVFVDDRCVCVIYGSKEDPAALAHCLYSSLLAFNEAGVQRIWAEGISTDGVGMAVMNRMDKASGHHIVHIT